MNACAWRLLAAATALLCSTSALAREPDVHFEWDRPATSLCPSRSLLQADVEDLLGRRVFGPRRDARMVVRGSVDDGPHGVTVRIDAGDLRGHAFGTRELSAPAGQCASLRDAIVLVLTLFIEHEVGADGDPDVRVGFGAEAALAQAPMPRFALSAGAALYLAIGPLLRLHARAAYWPQVSIRTERTGLGTTLEAFSLALRACAQVWAGLGVCGGVENGALLSVPLALSGPERQVRLLSHATLETGWALPLDSVLRAEIAGGALVSLSRPAFSYLRSDGERVAVYRPRALGAVFRVSIIILSD